MKIGLSLGWKFALVSMAFTIPIGTLLQFMISEKNKAIEFAALEQNGNDYLRSLNGIQTSLFKFRIASSTQDDLAATLVPSLIQAVENGFKELATKQARLGESLQVTAAGLSKRRREYAAPENLVKQWAAVKGLVGKPEFESRLLQLIAAIKDLITHVGDTSNLILDPDLDSYYLMDAVVLALPSATNRLQNVIDAYIKLSEKKARSQEEVVDFGVQVAFLKADFDRVKASAETAINEDNLFYGVNSTLQREVAITTNALDQAAEEFTRRLKASITAPTDWTLVDAGEKVLAQASDALELDQRVLSQLLAARVESIEESKEESLVYVLACWVLSGVLAFWLQRSVVGSVRLVLDRLKAVSKEIGASSSKLHFASQQSASAVAQEAAAIQESVAAMVEMNSMLSRTAQNTESANDLAQKTQDQTQAGSQTMQRMALSMNSLEEVNVKLKDITRIIEGIADKTNVINAIVFKTQLLAVNASIEAARAGQQGKGFSVVANEVSSLASMSGKAADEIRHLLNESRRQVLTIVENTGESVRFGKVVSADSIKAFEAISSAISDISNKVHRIFEATREQEVGVRQTSHAMQELNGATSRNNALARENASLSESIKTQGVVLEGIERAMSFVVLGK